MLATPELIHEATQAQRLAKSLPRYLNEVPLYCRRAETPGNPPNGVPTSFSHHGLSTSPGHLCPTLDQFGRLPLITKQDIRHNFPRNFLGDDADLENLLDQDLLELEHTSGTSEERTALLLPRGWWAQQELQALRLHPLVARVLDETPEARRVSINSPVCSGDISYNGVPSRDNRIVGNSLFVSLSRYPFLWSEADLARIARETLEWQPQFLDVDPVYGAIFALYCERKGIRIPSLRFILCSYEFVSIVSRRILQRVFGVPVLNLYGSTETGHLLMEDETAQMRPAYETAFLEVLPPDPQGVSELVVTTLTNPFMPLVRYWIGDLVERRVEPYRTRYIVHGRVKDAFVTSAGRRVTTWQIDRLFDELEGITHYQVIQRNEGPWLLRFVPHGAGPSLDALESLQHRLLELLKPTGGLTLQPTDMLVPETSGKFRLGYPI